MKEQTVFIKGADNLDAANDSVKEIIASIYHFIRLDFFNKDDEKGEKAVLRDWNEHEGNVDFAVSFLPLPPHNGTYMEFAIDSLKEMLSSLSDKGKLACVVPTAFLSHQQSLEMREMLVKDKLLDKVLLLSSRMSYVANQQIAVLFIGKQIHYSVKFAEDWNVDEIGYEDRVGILSSLLTFENRPTEDELKDANLWFFDEDFFDFYYDPDFDKHIGRANFGEIEGSHFSLHPNLYAKVRLPHREGFHLTDGEFFDFSDSDDFDPIAWEPNPVWRLGNLTLPVSEEEIAEKKKYKNGFVEGKVVTQSELRYFSSSASHLDVSSIKNKSYEGIYYELRNEKVVVMSLIGKLCPTVIEARGDEVAYIALENMCMLFECWQSNYNLSKINSDGKYKLRYDLEYVANEFSKDYVKEQLHYDSNGRLSIYDVPYLRIYLPDDTDSQTSLERQQEIVKEERRTHIQMLEAELGIERRELHLRKHRLANLLAQVKDGFDLLDLVWQEQGGILRDSDMLDACIEENVGQYFKQMQKSINKVAELVSHFIDEQSPTLERVSLRKFLEEFKNEYPKKNYKMELVFDVPDDSLCIVNVDKDMLRTGLENIARNAEMHGFLDSERKDYCLRFHLSEKETDGQHFFALLVANNGCPMDKSVEKDKIFEWGYGSHTGLGMWELKKTMEYFGGKLKLQEEPSDTDFPVEFEILLPKV